MRQRSASAIRYTGDAQRVDHRAELGDRHVALAPEDAHDRLLRNARLLAQVLAGPAPSTDLGVQGGDQCPLKLPLGHGRDCSGPTPRSQAAWATTPEIGLRITR